MTLPRCRLNVFLEGVDARKLRILGGAENRHDARNACSGAQNQAARHVTDAAQTVCTYIPGGATVILTEAVMTANSACESPQLTLGG